MSEALFTLCLAATIGVVLMALSGRLKMPSIALLLISGVALGPEGFGVIDPSVLGGGLKMVVSMAVAIILFDGGLSLDLHGARRSPVVIGRLLTIGVVVTWLGAASAIWLLFCPRFEVALLCGSLVIVTGPTVVSPLLRRMNIRDRLKQILYWEAVLVDAIGVFIAVLLFEWISPDAGHTGWSPVLRFAIRIGIGAGVGVAAGMAVAIVLRRHVIPEEHANVMMLAVALLTYATSDYLLHESGVLAVILAGFTLRIARPANLDQLRKFGLEVTELGIGTLFILLAATLRLDPFIELGWPLALAVLALVVLRPISVALATWGRGYSRREKAFLAWVAPRGIVAAFMASLFALELADQEGYEFAAQLIHTFTFAVIGATVIVQGTSAPLMAKMLKLGQAPRTAWLVVGDSTVAPAVADALAGSGVASLVLMANPGERATPGRRKPTVSSVLIGDPLDRALLDDPLFADVGSLIAVSPNRYFNLLVCERWAEVLGHGNCYHWSDAADQTRTDGFAGRPVWSYAGRPSAVSGGLDAGTLAVSAVDTGHQRLPWPDDQVLFRVAGDRAQIIDSADGEERPPDGNAIVLRTRIPGLHGLVRDGLVLDDEGADLGGVVRALLALAQESDPQLPVDELLELIVERERSMPTALGAGVAIPHAYHDAVNEPHCYVAIVRNGVDAATPDDEPLRLVFLVLSPPGHAEAHLTSLAAIATLCKEARFVRLLESQETGAALLGRIGERA